MLDDNEEYGLQVTLDNGLQTSVALGEALIKGYSYQNTTPLVLTHSLPETTNDRIDRIVLRLDLRNQNRFIKVFIKEGVTSATPIAPTLQRDEYIYELSLAQVRLRANTASIVANDIKDERALEDVCGIVQSLITVPISIFQQQFDAWFNNQKLLYETDITEWQINEKAEFETWVESLHDILDGNVAANLASRITTVEQELTTHKTEDAAVKASTDKILNDFESTKNLSITRSNKDKEGIFTTLTYKRKGDNTLYATSVLSGGATPKYTTRTIKFYDVDGVTLLKTTTKTLLYDVDGD